jgi:hypothetical protein
MRYLLAVVAVLQRRPAIPASATWRIDPAKLGGSGRVVIDDGGDELIMDATIGSHASVITDCSSNLTC